MNLLKALHIRGYAEVEHSIPSDLLLRGATTFAEMIETISRNELGRTTHPFKENPRATPLGHTRKEGKMEGGEWQDPKDYAHVNLWWLHQKREVLELSAENPLFGTFCTHAEQIYVHASVVAKRILQELSDTFPVFTTHFLDEGAIPGLVIRFLTYDSTTPPGGISAANHVDMSGLTLTLFESTPGLRIWPLNSPKHHDPIFTDGKSIVMTGEPMERLTEGVFQAVTHCVIRPFGLPEGEKRVSIIAFVDPIPGKVALPSWEKTHPTFKKREISPGDL